MNTVFKISFCVLLFHFVSGKLFDFPLEPCLSAIKSERMQNRVSDRFTVEEWDGPTKAESGLQPREWRVTFKKEGLTIEIKTESFKLNADTVKFAAETVSHSGDILVPISRIGVGALQEEKQIQKDGSETETELGTYHIFLDLKYEDWYAKLNSGKQMDYGFGFFRKEIDDAATLLKNQLIRTETRSSPTHFILRTTVPLDDNPKSDDTIFLEIAANFIVGNAKKFPNKDKLAWPISSVVIFTKELTSPTTDDGEEQTKWVHVVFLFQISTPIEMFNKYRKAKQFLEMNMTQEESLPIDALGRTAGSFVDPRNLQYNIVESLSNDQSKIPIFNAVRRILKDPKNQDAILDQYSAVRFAGLYAQNWKICSEYVENNALKPTHISFVLKLATAHEVLTNYRNRKWEERTMGLTIDNACTDIAVKGSDPKIPNTIFKYYNVPKGQCKTENDALRKGAIMFSKDMENGDEKKFRKYGIGVAKNGMIWTALGNLAGTIQVNVVLREE